MKNVGKKKTKFKKKSGWGIGVGGGLNRTELAYYGESPQITKYGGILFEFY